MPPIKLAVLALTLLGTMPAVAGSRTGGGGKGGGPLSGVSSGIGGATGGASPASGGSRGNDRATDQEERYCQDRDTGREVACPTHIAGSVVVLERPSTRNYSGDRARVDFYAGAQKVQDSDGSVSLELAVIDYRFRMTGALTHYFETLPDGGKLTMSMPSLLAGFRIDDMGRTAVYLEGGVVFASTKGDPMEDSSITGAIGGVRVEHRLTRRVSLIGDAQTMAFESDIRAQAGRVGVRVGHLQASLRVLDFNVGPALYGPEVGLRF